MELNSPSILAAANETAISFIGMEELMESRISERYKRHQFVLLSDVYRLLHVAELVADLSYALGSRPSAHLPAIASLLARANAQSAFNDDDVLVYFPPARSNYVSGKGENCLLIRIARRSFIVDAFLVQTSSVGNSVVTLGKYSLSHNLRVDEGIAECVDVTEAAKKITASYFIHI